MNIFEIIARILGALTNIFVASVADMFVGSVPTEEDDNKLYTYHHRSQHYQHYQEKRQLLINDSNSSSLSPLHLKVDTDGLNLSSNRLRGCGQFLSDACVMDRIDVNKNNSNNCLNKSFIDILRQILRFIIETPTLLASAVPPITSTSNSTMVAAPITPSATDSSLIPLMESAPEGSQRSSSSQPTSLNAVNSSSLTLAMGVRHNLPIGYERACRLAMKQRLSSTHDRHNTKIPSDISLQIPLVSAPSMELTSHQQEQVAGGEESEEQLSTVLINTLWRCSPTDNVQTPMQRLQSDYLWDIWFNARNIDGLNPFIVEMNRSLRNEVSVTVALNNCRKLSADARRNAFLLSHGLTYEYFESQQMQYAGHQLEARSQDQSRIREELCSLDLNCSGPAGNSEEVFGLSNCFRHMTNDYSRQLTIPNSIHPSSIVSNDELVNGTISQAISVVPSYSAGHVQTVEESLLEGRGETFLSIMESLDCTEVDYNIIQFGTVTKQLLDQIGYFNDGINNGLEYTFFVDFDENIDSPSSLLSSEEERDNQPLNNTNKEDINTRRSQSCQGRPLHQEDYGPGLDRSLLRALMANKVSVLATAARAKAKATAAAAAFFLAATAAARTVANIQKNQDQNNAGDIPQSTLMKNDGLKQDSDVSNSNNVESSMPSHFHYYWDSNSLLNYVFLQEYQRQLALHYQYVLAQHIQQILPTAQHQDLFMNQLLRYQAQLQQQIHHHVQLRLKQQNDQQEEQNQQHRQTTHLDVVPYSSSTSLLSSPSISDPSLPSTSPPISPPTSPTTSPPTSPRTSPPTSPRPSRRILPQTSQISSTSLTLSSSSSLPLPSLCPSPSSLPPFPTPSLTVFQSPFKAPSYSTSTSPSASFQSRTFCQEVSSNADLNINCITLMPPYLNMQQLMQKLNDQSQYYQQQFVAALNAYEGILCTQFMRHQYISNMTVTALQPSVQTQCQQQQQHLHQQHHCQFYQQQIQLQQMQDLQQQEQQQLSQLQQQFQQREHQLLLPKPMNEMDLPTCSYRQTSPRLDLTSPSNDPPDPTLPSRRFWIPTSPIPSTISWTEGDFYMLPSPYPNPYYYNPHYDYERREPAITTNTSDNNSNLNSDLATDDLLNTYYSSNSDPIDDDQLEEEKSNSVLSTVNSNDDIKHEDEDGNNAFDEINISGNNNNNIIQCSNREDHAINDQNTDNGNESNDILKTAIHISYNTDNNKKAREQ